MRLIDMFSRDPFTHLKNNIFALFLYRRVILQDYPLSAVSVAWQVWWAAGVDMALCATTKVRQKLSTWLEAILHLS